MSAERVKLTEGQRKALSTVLERGPGPFALTSAGRTPAPVAQLVAMGHLERLNRLRPGLPVYEITAAGRAAVAKARA